jgi:alkaline phosphatase D
MMAPLRALGLVLNTDQWDGYPAERNKIYSTILDNNIQNLVVLTGDIHTSWANDLPGTGYNSSTGAGRVGVEYVDTSVTSSSLPLGVSSAIITAANPHIKWSELTRKGYLVLDVNKERTQGDWWFCTNITSSSPEVSLGAKYHVNNGERHLRVSPNVSVRLNGFCPLAPMIEPNASTTANKQELTWIGAYPNPFEKEITIQYNAAVSGEVEVQVVSIDGKLVNSFKINAQQGLNYIKIDGDNMNNGTYQIMLKSAGFNKLVRLVKI